MKTDHTKFANVGDYTHDEIDAHIDNVSNPHAVTATQVGGPYLPGGYQAINWANTITVDFSLGATAKIILSDNITTLTLDNSKMVSGGTYVLILTQSSGPHTIGSWAITSGSLTWAGKTVPVLSTGASDEDIITFKKGVTGVRGAITLDFG